MMKFTSKCYYFIEIPKMKANVALGRIEDEDTNLHKCTDDSIGNALNLPRMKCVPLSII